jgi:hypothetical protein
VYIQWEQEPRAATKPSIEKLIWKIKVPGNKPNQGNRKHAYENYKTLLHEIKDLVL